jgi:hypothetical protein
MKKINKVHKTIMTLIRFLRDLFFFVIILFCFAFIVSLYPLKNRLHSGGPLVYYFPLVQKKKRSHNKD